MAMLPTGCLLVPSKVHAYCREALLGSMANAALAVGQWALVPSATPPAALLGALTGWLVNGDGSIFKLARALKARSTEQAVCLGAWPYVPLVSERAESIYAPYRFKALSKALHKRYGW